MLHRGQCDRLDIDARVLMFQLKHAFQHQDRVYQDALACGDVSQIALEGDKVVGALVARLEAKGQEAHLYIVSLGVLAPYRGQRIGSQLLERSLAAIADDEAVVSAFLHVHTANTEAVTFYIRHGFVEEEMLRGYYRRLDPPDAVLMRKMLQPSGSHQAAAADACAGLRNRQRLNCPAC